jgi:hypothetical protein
MDPFAQLAESIIIAAQERRDDGNSNPITGGANFSGTSSMTIR